MAEESPHLRVEDGVRYLVYMYGHWVLRWSHVSRATTDIGFDTVDSHCIEHRGVSITGDWNPESLIAFGRG